MSQTKQVSTFQCAVCNERVSFNPRDPTTFESKTPHEKFFGMQLTTYRVSHMVGSERHVNTIIVDHMDLFRGHKDAFVEQVKGEKAEQQLWLVSQKPATLESHPFFDCVFIMDRDDSWVLEGVTSSEVRILELARLLAQRVEEAERVYESLPDELNFTIADQDLRVWTKGSRIACGALKGPAAFGSLSTLLKETIREPHRDAIPDKRLLVLGLHAIAVNPKIDSSVLLKLVGDDRLFSKIDFQYIPRIPSIVDRVERKFDFAEEILVPLLSGKASVIDLLEQGQIGRIQKVFDMLEHVERRGLLG
ncbi:MAG: hypothetical protein BAJATHORv1_50054 [Candidatus Thorarchaeota archaeon]|nr:MAG: hypothetical protein BAJATHORv1_50054 [Candidatus Thorarchaeota archaeon]